MSANEIIWSIITPHCTTRGNEKAIESTRQQLSAISDIVRDPLSGVELISIDNASEHEESVSMIRDISTVYVRNKVNVGFGRAMNQGMKLARGRFFLLLSNDVLLTDIKHLLEELSSTCVRYTSVAFPSFSNKSQSLDGLYHGGEWDGSCFMVMRKFTEEIGMYDERFFAYFEDTDWFLRSIRRGWRLIRSGEVLVHHLESLTSKDLGNRGPEFERSKEKFLEKWGPSGLDEVNFNFKEYGGNAPVLGPNYSVPNDRR